MGRVRVDMGQLREETAARAEGVCEWARCSAPGTEMAHLRGKGMGGNPDGSRNVIANTVWLCRYHHDLLDGRTLASAKFETRMLLEEFVRYERRSRGVE